MPEFTPRNVSPIIQHLRNFLLGRKFEVKGGSLRFAPYISKRDQPPPMLPPGVHHKLSANYYCTRDGRREIGPPAVLVENTGKKLLAAGTSGEKAQLPAASKPKTPGPVYRWD